MDSMRRTAAERERVCDLLHSALSGPGQAGPGEMVSVRLLAGTGGESRRLLAADPCELSSLRTKIASSGF